MPALLETEVVFDLPMPFSLDSFLNPPFLRAARRLAFARYGFAVGCALVAAFAWDGIAAPLSDATPYQVLLPFVALAAWFGGTGPGLFCTLFCTAWALTHSEGEMMSVAQEIELALFFPIGAFIAALCGSLGRARERADETAQRLALSQELYQSIVETASEGIWTLDKNFNTTFANERMAQLLGTSPEAMMGRPLADWIFAVDLEILNRDLAAGSFEKPHEAERRYRRADGAEIWFLLSATPLRSKSGELEGFLALHTDVSARRVQESLLRASHERFETATRAIDGYIYEIDERKGEIYRSAGFFDVLGYDAATSTTDAKWWRERIHPEDRAAFDAQNKAVRARVSTAGETPRSEIESTKNQGAAQFALECRVLHADGTYRTLWDRGVAMRDENGEFQGIIGSVSDVSRRRETENALRQSEANFRLLADSMPQIVWAAQPDGAIDYVNRRWYEYSGQQEDKIGLDNWVALVHPDDLAPSLAQLSHCIASGELFRAEQRWRDKNGIYRWFLCRSAPIFDLETGDITRWFGTATDIDDQKRAADTQSFLAEIGMLLGDSLDLQVTLEQVTRLAVPTLGDWCFVALTNAQNHPEMVAAAHLEPEKVAAFWTRHHKYGFNPNATKGFPAVIRNGEAELIEEVDAEMWRAALPHQPGYQDEVSGVGHRSTLVVPLEVRGRILGALGFSYAESGRRFSNDDLPLAQEIARRAAIAIENARLYERLQDADARKDEFLAMLAHELRNPLAAIAGAGTLLDMMLQGSAKIETATPRAILTRQTAQLARLVDDLMDVSRITRGKIELRLQTTDFNSIIRIALDGVRPLILSRRHDLRLELPPHPVEIEGDPTRLGQIVSNLVNNAAKYTDIGGKITVSLETSATDAIFRVRDNGTGLKPEMLDGIWDLFVQSDRTLDRAQGGLGIGLTLVKSLAEMHGGRVEARSDGLGMGSEFIVALPLASMTQTAVPETANDSTREIVPDADAPPEHPIEKSNDSTEFVDGQDSAQEMRNQSAQTEELAGAANGVSLNNSEQAISTKNEGASLSDAVNPEKTLDSTKNEEAHRRSSRDQVLVVDDNKDAASMLCAWLEIHGYDVQVAHDGAHGLALACGWQPDIALLDIGMPGMDGYEVARQLRALPAGRSMRLVAVTGYGQPADRNRALAAGFDFHLTKPVEIEKLRKILEL